MNIFIVQRPEEDEFSDDGLFIHAGNERAEVSLSRRLVIEAHPTATENQLIAAGTLVQALLSSIELEREHGQPMPIAVDRSKSNYTPRLSEIYDGYTFKVNFAAYDKAYEVLLNGGWLHVVAKAIPKVARTKIAPTEKFRELAKTATIEVKAAKRGIVVLKDAEKRWVPYDQSAVARLQANLNTINAAVEAAPLFTFVRDGKERAIAVDDLKYNRIFNRDFERGGRFSSIAQGLRKEERKTIRIGGKATVELDFGSMMPSLAYALKGLHLQGRAYDVEGVGEGDKSVAKSLLLTMFNAKNGNTAIYSTAKDIYQDSNHIPEPGTGVGNTTRERVALVLDALLAAHDPIRDFFFAGKGLELMRLESAIAERVLLSMAGQTIPCLAVHDSFIVPQGNELQLRTAMQQAFREVLTLRSDAYDGEWTPAIK